jgi:hypothetical protein
MVEILVISWEQNGVPFRDCGTPICPVADASLTGYGKCCSDGTLTCDLVPTSNSRHPEERALARVSKDGNNDGARGDPSRRGQEAALGMTAAWVAGTSLSSTYMNGV